MKGCFHRLSDKWDHMCQILCENHIGILALQETHLSLDEARELNNKYKDYLVIYCLIHPGRPNSAGVEFVLNKQIARVDDIKIKELIPGQALLLDTAWHSDKQLRLLNIYAHNETDKNADFWVDVCASLNATNQVDALLGDFNMTEDALDRLPPRHEHGNQPQCLNELTSRLNMIDGW